MSIWAMGSLIGPVIGPVAGGFLSQAKGWRWVFWILAIAVGSTATEIQMLKLTTPQSGVITIVALLVLRETYPPTLLERRASRLRRDTGNEKLVSKLDSGLSPKDLFIRSIVRPTKMLCLSPIVLALSTFMAVAYGYLYLLFTTITEVFEGTYGFSQGTVGLTYLGIGIGSIVGLVAFGVSSDLIMKKKSAKGEMKPEYRLPPMIPGAMFIPIGLFWYGWTAEKHVFWLVPIIGTTFVGLGILATFVSIYYLSRSCDGHIVRRLTLNRCLFRYTSWMHSPYTQPPPWPPTPFSDLPSEPCSLWPVRRCTRLWAWVGETPCSPLSRWLCARCLDSFSNTASEYGHTRAFRSGCRYICLVRVSLNTCVAVH